MRPTVPDTASGQAVNNSIQVLRGHTVKVGAICDIGGKLEISPSPEGVQTETIPMPGEDLLAGREGKAFVWTPTTSGKVTVTYTKGSFTQTETFDVTVNDPPPPPAAPPPPCGVDKHGAPVPCAPLPQVPVIVNTRLQQDSCWNASKGVWETCASVPYVDNAVRNQFGRKWFELGFNHFGFTDVKTYGGEINFGYHLGDPNNVNMTVGMSGGIEYGRTRIVNPDLQEMPGAHKSSYRFQLSPWIGVSSPVWAQRLELFAAVGAGVKVFQQDSDLVYTYPDGAMAGLDEGSFWTVLVKGRVGARVHFSPVFLTVGLTPECNVWRGQPKASGYGINKQEARCQLAGQAGLGLIF